MWELEMHCKKKKTNQTKRRGQKKRTSAEMNISRKLMSDSVKYSHVQ